MSVFYNYIKGLSLAGGTNNYTFLNWQNSDVPTLTYSSTKDYTGGTSAGKIACADYENTFSQTNTFSSTTIFSDIATFSEGLTVSENKNLTIGTSTLNYSGTDSQLTVSTSELLLNCTSFQVQVNSTDILVVDSFGATVTGECQATSFNATSDIRAKENISPLMINALDIVNNMSLYSFNFKDTKEKSIGVIAQDLLDIDIQGFSFVANKDATGLNGDYMSVKESKLVYLLLKAIQEQQEEIEDLKLQIQALQK